MNTENVKDDLVSQYFKLVELRRKLAHKIIDNTATEEDLKNMTIIEHELDELAMATEVREYFSIDRN